MSELDDVSLLRPPRNVTCGSMSCAAWGLWMIFLDHIPHDVVSWLTLRNYGYSAMPPSSSYSFPATSPVSSMAPIVHGGHFLAAAKRLLTRALAIIRRPHPAVLDLHRADCPAPRGKFDNPMYENEFNVYNFLQHPDVLIGAKH